MPWTGVNESEENEPRSEKLDIPKNLIFFSVKNMCIQKIILFIYLFW